MTDPIADMITRIRNAVRSRHPRVDIPASRFKAEIARILEQEGYVSAVKVVDGAPQGTIRITLKYGPRGENVISGEIADKIGQTLEQVWRANIRRPTIGPDTPDRPTEVDKATDGGHVGGKRQ